MVNDYIDEITYKFLLDTPLLEEFEDEDDFWN